jgi:ADP-ribosylglycohydrolase
MLNEKEFFDRVYACWMGKNIGGTLGGPLEGRMELMDIKGYTQSFISAVENDDLDLQLVNLHCVEQNGGRADVQLLSREWLDHVHFEFDEYGHAMTNMRRGLGAPLSGHYNNFFTDCMGSPIRSEIWAVICAGMPDLAAYYAYHDASVDHAGGEGVYGEIFFAVLESLAFEEQDKFKLIHAALAYLPETSEVRQAVELLLDCHGKGLSWVEARQQIIDRFAGDNFTYAPVNIAFTLVGWLYEEGFTQQMLTTINCGYDTDCTVATLGSLLGILYGTSYLDAYWTEPLGENIVVSRPITGFDAPKTISELTQRSIEARKLVQAHYEQQADKSVYKIPYQAKVEVYDLPLGAFKHHDLKLEMEYEDGCPAFAPGEKKILRLKVRNLQKIPQTLVFCPRADGFVCSKAEMELAGGEEKTAEVVLEAPEAKQPLYRGQMEIRRIINGVYWNSDFVPMTLLPSMDCRVELDGVEKALALKENRIALKDMGEAAQKSLKFATDLWLTDAGSSVLKLACKNPLTAKLDGKTIIDCAEETIVIPAYHRADPRKCAEINAAPGKHHLEIEIRNPQQFTELYFMVVSNDLYWAYRLDAVFA